MPMAILVWAEFIKRVRAAFRGPTWNAGHAHGRRRIHSHQSLDCGMRAVAKVRQQAVGDAATVRALDLVRANFFKIVIHAVSPFLSQHFLIQRSVVELMAARQFHVKCI